MLRLFHEEKVLSFDKEPVKFECSCSRERTLSSIETLGEEDALEILENTATIAVDCQFCRKHYEFDRADIVELFRLGSSH
jgi:molecular chaperone Hsp33